jgi:hypothetical protein
MASSVDLGGNLVAGGYYFLGECSSPEPSAWNRRVWLGLGAVMAGLEGIPGLDLDLVILGVLESSGRHLEGTSDQCRTSVHRRLPGR